MKKARETQGSIDGAESRPDIPLEETNFAVWTRTTMLDDDTADGAPDPTVLRGID